MSKLFDLINSIIDRVNSSVKTTPQTLTEAEKTQVKDNLGLSNVITPDWSQSDETAPDYVKNRTHYIDRKVLERRSYDIKQYSSTYSDLDWGSTDRSICNVSDVKMPDNVYVRASVFGEEHIFTSIPPNVSTSSVPKYKETVTLDNGIILTFSLSRIQYGSNKQDRRKFYYNVQATTTDTSLIGQEYTFEIIEETLVQLDEKFIPSTIARVSDIPDIVDAAPQIQSDWTQSDDTQVDFIKNKPAEITPDMIMEFMAEVNAAQPIADGDGQILTTIDDEILIL